ncbi:hypothetical protein A2524_00880 [Candidatus Wolfebacteria bacterium RIFOXYD12_FULL_48_21]|uniref:DUF4760 domain-containing protein n=1 Tax=Candidatus Wolfebacteria bacterium RIFOXYD1_FULL_48_65 TaxID=1802561 RepID=A0A1F8E0F8_9BACT|nr:MAG: hypothetical protein A2610_02825 [Candidatus Wolfebacteria bacterium RIFOXYD1_FULL_48_65]OGM94363.1 MAG: hypothetical protein A2524_00880 [Candidatus Wolfebacteria bacterium RIFOXYD12_FULL_48_21]OGM96949.1 MAG: hypothetical protein A2532_01325 [Candidatus Wolfebacteria bacterium RIFOXYD2_FULL_48_11]
MEYFFQYIFSGIATIVTGTVAIAIYFHQKRNNKIQAARVLLTEIRTAEEQIGVIREKIITGDTSDMPNSVFQTNNWKKYAHLFVSNFDQDDLKLINSFYDYGELIEEFAKRESNYFWIATEERARITVQMIARFVDEEFHKIPQERDTNNIELKKQFFNVGMDNHNTPYSPKKTLKGIENRLSKIQTITTSSTGAKLKKLAKLDK